MRALRDGHAEAYHRLTRHRIAAWLIEGDVLYMLLAAMAAVVEAWFIGAAIGLLAEWRRVSGRLGFAAGFASGLIVVMVGGWMGLVLVLIPIVAILSLPSTPEVDPTGTGHRQRIAMWVLQVGMLVIVGLIAYSPLVAGMASLRQTGSTDAAIVDSYPTMVATPVAGQPGPPYQLVIEYEFTVGGVTYSGMVQKPWASTSGAKVCYQPDDPGGNRSLQKAGYQCGGFDAFGS
jgi:hypothetical protein